MERSEDAQPGRKNSLENSIVIQKLLADDKKKLSEMEVSFLKMFIKTLQDSKRELLKEFENYKQYCENTKKIYQEKLEEQKAIYEDRIISQRKIFQDKLDEQRGLYIGHMESLIRENLFHKQMLESADRTIKTSMETIVNLSKNETL